MMIQHRSRTLAAACLLAATTMLAASGCAKSETPDNAGDDSSQAAQAAKSPESSSGSGCSLRTYGAPKLDLKDAVVGFSQSEKEANPFRIAETRSIKDEAEKIGVKKLLTTNAQSQLSKQISDIQDMLSQGAQFLIVAPLNSDGLEPAFKAAAAKKVPVLTIDRKVNSTACKDYVTFLGSDFVEQGKRAADAMIKATGGKGKVAILLGASGNNVTTDRTKGFVDQVKAQAPGLRIVARQTGEFARDKGQQVMEQLIQSKPDITAVYAENDEMGLGAVTALKAADKKPGKDVKIVSVDGTRNAVQALVNGEYNAVIESNPRFGPLAFATAQKFYGGEEIPENVIISDRAYDESNAKASLGGAY
ncbi:ABC transporter substrate-binding protein [Streptomyces sp. NBC_00825]|uniref:ABC transporter substrate-binding protein n=1 Tax=unclassified Streptomyces TaxID=2593676 RepID=UPI0022586FFC|nr:MULTISPECIES: ABC transporter substrate-binding protein [unclassified Streptomyces]WTB52569.1 ABC transporter substrate-binding protein [Streptomyces sp. NBC_00826]WTH94539.1 ABC transporter substrate-binding protein [Streptomyces sp. NBC_00825]WTI03274.1 ABC transporter substrate-binding protein [Streptomyces sp. NBC_00822]MCX4868822.1 ABC transporter substrate-binding protein [Streptomyces sp. NBC_00906]MCX4900060.1 ABC transporter substrate-binding protein [Streptomyces sp. NBC_00892]